MSSIKYLYLTGIIEVHCSIGIKIILYSLSADQDHKCTFFKKKKKRGINSLIKNHTTFINIIEIGYMFKDIDVKYFHPEKTTKRFENYSNIYT